MIPDVLISLINNVKMFNVMSLSVARISTFDIYQSFYHIFVFNVYFIVCYVKLLWYERMASDPVL